MTRVVLLDGGTSLELLARSANKSPRHWSSEYLMTEPDLVRAVHRDYIAAGAKVVTINTYSATFTRMAMVNAEEKVPEMQRVACELAIEARAEAGASDDQVAIAGCLPPLNGTYRPDRVRDFDVNVEEYRRLAELQAPYVDFYLCETMSTGEEARAAALAAAEFGKPVWVGWTLADRGACLRNGETIREAVARLDGIDVSAVVANCAPPEGITAAIPELIATGRPAGGYANAFTAIPLTFVPGKTKEQLVSRTDLSAEVYARFALGWAAAGAKIVGGCCEVGPVHIARLRDDLLAAGYEISTPRAAFGA